jgi:hypothetical protein
MHTGWLGKYMVLNPGDGYLVFHNQNTLSAREKIIPYLFYFRRSQLLFNQGQGQDHACIFADLESTEMLPLCCCIYFLMFDIP